MNELTSLPDDELVDDVIVSAVLDGEATADEVARVESEPRLAARLEVMRTVASATGSSVPAPPQEVVDASIARALASSLSPASTPGATAVHDPIEPVALIAPASTTGRRPGLRTLSIAAAVLAAVLAPVVLSLTGDGGDQDQATSESAAELSAREEQDQPTAAGSDEAGDRSDSGTPALRDAPSGLELPAADAATVEVIDLGPLPDEEALRQAVLDLVATQAGGLPPPTAVVPSDEFEARDPARCLAQATLPGSVGASPDRVQGWADYQGEPVTVYISLLRDGGREVVALASQSCAERARLVLGP